MERSVPSDGVTQGIRNTRNVHPSHQKDRKGYGIFFKCAEAWTAYRSDTKNLPRLEVDEFPEAFVKVAGRRVPMRVIGEEQGKIVAITQSDFNRLGPTAVTQGATTFALAPDSVSLAAPNAFPREGGNGAEDLLALKPYHAGTIDSLPSAGRVNCSAEVYGH